MNGMRAIAFDSSAVFQNEIAGLVRKANQISGSGGCGHSFGRILGEHPCQMRRPQRLRPRPVPDDRHQRPMRVAAARLR